MTLRARLISGFLLVAVVLVCAGFLTVHIARDNLVAQVDDRLQAFFQRPNLSCEPRQGPFVVCAPFDYPVPDFGRTEVEEGAAQGVPFTLASQTGEEWRAVVGRIRGSPQVALAVASLADVDRSIDRLVLLEVVVTASILSLLGVVGFWVLRLGVRPIKEMTSSAVAIAAGDLSHRVPVAPAGTEAAELGDALNTMMGRIEGAFGAKEASEARLRRFVADASHELRTPVTTIRGYAELYRNGGLEAREDLAQAMGRTESEAKRMGLLIEDLLLLARLDQGRPLEITTVDLGVLAGDAVADARAVAPDREIGLSVAGGVRLAGDEARLRQVVGNLVSNSLVHTPADSPVEVRVGATEGCGVIEVVDGGPGMPPEVAARAFERFVRADQSRSREKGGTGLGLSIVQAIVEAHGGRVSLSSDELAGTTVRVELPWQQPHETAPLTIPTTAPPPPS